MRELLHKVLYDTKTGDALLLFLERHCGLAIVLVEPVAAETVALMEVGE